MSISLYDIEIFGGVSPEEHDWLIANSTIVDFAPGEYFSHEHDDATCMYVVLEGEMQITRTINGERRVMGTTPRGIIGGELSLLYDSAAQVDAVAILPTRLLVFQADAFRRIFGAVPKLGGRILNIAMERAGGLATQVSQEQKIDALGKFAANLAHTLNNPAAAASRSAKTLGSVIPHLQELTLRLNGLNLNEVQILSLAALQQDAIRGASAWQPLEPLERADKEDQMAAWLREVGIDEPEEIAYAFVSANISVDDVRALLSTLPREHQGAVLNWLSEVLNMASLLHEIDSSTTRISELVDEVKEYTYMDRGRAQEVRLNRDLDNTLRMFSGRLRNVIVKRVYDPNLPHILGRGSELNQVWTNIIENALDAMHDQGELHLITRCENEFVMVEITDSGMGIPETIMPHIFEPFFSTKKFASGTPSKGLGLDIAYRIIRQHNASINVFSVPGETRFIVRLPMNTINSDAAAK